MNFSNDTRAEQELAALKKVKLGLESALANEKNERVKVEHEVAEALRKHKEDIFRVSWAPPRFRLLIDHDWTDDEWSTVAVGTGAGASCCC